MIKFKVSFEDKRKYERNQRNKNDEIKVQNTTWFASSKCAHKSTAVIGSNVHHVI